MVKGPKSWKEQIGPRLHATTLTSGNYYCEQLLAANECTQMSLLLFCLVIIAMRQEVKTEQCYRIRCHYSIFIFLLKQQILEQKLLRKCKYNSIFIFFFNANYSATKQKTTNEVMVQSESDSCVLVSSQRVRMRVEMTKCERERVQ